MRFLHGLGAALAASVLLVSGACQSEAEAGPAAAQAVRKVEVTVDSAGGPRVFHVELARTTAEQERGLMFRTNIPQDGGMLFAPYPADGPPREASFWMKNTPTIARIGENAVPFSEENVKSG